MATQTLKFVEQDTGFCRVYYRGSEDRMLYCIQDDGSFGKRNLKFYVCTKDGEPSHEVKFPVRERFDNYVEP